MISWKLTDLYKMEPTEVPGPVITNDNEVLIKMEVLGVCGSDIHYYKTGRINDQVVEYPFTVGHEGAGTIVKTGSAVKSLREGDRVAIEPAMPCHECDQCKAGRQHTCRKLRFLGCPGQAEGCLSEYIVMPEHSCFKISDSMSFDQAALSEPLSIGLYATRLAGDLRNKSIAILGFGPIGMSVMLAARTQDPKAFMVTDLLDPRLSLAKKSGAILVSNPEQEDSTKTFLQQAPSQPDVVFECCGKQEALDQAIELLKPGGKLMIVGIPEFDHWKMSVDKLRRKELSIHNVRRQNNCVQETLDLLDSDRIKAGAMVTHRFPFSDSKAAFDLVAGYHDGVMKCMIDF